MTEAGRVPRGAAAGPKRDEHNLLLLFLIKEKSAFICLFNSLLTLYVLLPHNSNFPAVFFFFLNMQVKWKLHNNLISVQGHYKEITFRLAF